MVVEELAGRFGFMRLGHVPSRPCIAAQELGVESKHTGSICTAKSTFFGLIFVGIVYTRKSLN